jgi:hypothetical protein
MEMTTTYMKKIKALVCIFGLGVSLTACADRWKEEVLLHDGKKMMIERSQTYKGRSEIGQSTPIGEHKVTFALPGSSKKITWVSEYGEELGRTNFNLLAVHVKDNVPYVVASPNLCLSYNKWGRPNPPYVFFKYEAGNWKRIGIEAFPPEFKTINVALDIRGAQVRNLVKAERVSAEEIADLNKSGGRPEQLEFKSIIRDPVSTPNGLSSCEKLVPYGDGGWLGLDWFSDQPSYEACVSFCEKKSVTRQNCPCASLFKKASQ